MKAERGPIHFEYQGDQLVRRVFHEGRLRHESRYAWAEGRLAQVEWSGYLQTFEYDAAGRLARDLLRADNGTKNERLVVWSYDEHGRVTAREDGPVPGEGPRQTTAYVFDGGLLRQVVRNGAVAEEYAYQGDCGAVPLGHPPPDALALTGGRYCLTSPGFLIHQCF